MPFKKREQIADWLSQVEKVCGVSFSQRNLVKIRSIAVRYWIKIG
jgi:hypothetical protein